MPDTVARIRSCRVHRVVTGRLPGSLPPVTSDPLSWAGHQNPIALEADAR